MSKPKVNTILFVSMLVVALVLKAYYAWYWPKLNISIGNKEYKVLAATNYSHWQKGLGGRNSLKRSDGMIFVFKNQEQHTIVMRDMEFPIDILWIKNSEIVDIAPDVPAEPGVEEGQLTRYQARLPSDIVVEFPAGVIKRDGIKIGDKFKIISEYKDN